MYLQMVKDAHPRQDIIRALFSSAKHRSKISGNSLKAYERQIDELCSKFDQ